MVFFTRVNDNTVFNNRATRNNHYGLYLGLSDGNTVERNNFANQEIGMVLFETSNNILRDNRLCNNWLYRVFYLGTNTGNVNDHNTCFTFTHSIDIYSPIFNNTFGETAPDFQITINTSNLDEMWYTLNNSDIRYYFTVNGTINQTAWDKLGDGDIPIRFYASDMVRNIDFREVVIIKETDSDDPPDPDPDPDPDPEPEPTPNNPAIPGYSLWYILGIIVIGIISKKNKLR